MNSLLETWWDFYLEIVFYCAFMSNMWTLKLKAQATNVCFATVNQMFGVSSQL